MPQLLAAYRQSGFSFDEGAADLAANKYIQAYSRLTAKGVTPDRDKSFGLYKAYDALTEIYLMRGDYEHAKEVLRNGVKQLSNTSADTAKLLQFDLDRLELVGRPAPPIEGEYWINAEPSQKRLELGGKVTLIEFTANWCVPCRMSYPAIIRLHEKFANRGLQVVFGTELYGSHGREPNLTAEQEVAADKKYYQEEHKITFPIAIAGPSAQQKQSASDRGKTNSQNYFSQAIPQIVVVDRKGIVRRVKVGWDVGDEELLNVLLDKLLDEK